MASTGKNLLAVVSGYQERSLLPDRPKARWKCAKAAVLLIFQRCVGDRFLGCLQLGFLFCEAEVPATPVEGSEPNPALLQPRRLLAGISSKNVISYYDAWHVAPYFVRGSSVLIGWAARLLPIDSDRWIWKPCLVKKYAIRDR